MFVELILVSQGDCCGHSVIYPSKGPFGTFTVWIMQAASLTSSGVSHIVSCKATNIAHQSYSKIAKYVNF